MKRLTLLLFFLGITGMAQAQAFKLVTMSDVNHLITDEVDSLVTEKFRMLGIIYTERVDMKMFCDYAFAELRLVGDTLVLRVEDCDRNRLGRKSLGTSFARMSPEDQANSLFFAILSIINSQEVRSGSESPDSSFFGNGLHNPHASRYFFMPSAYNLHKGELYYNTVFFLVHDLQYGISENFSFGMGAPIIPLVFYVSPKVSFRIDDQNRFAVGDLFLVGTFGLKTTNNLLYACYTGGSEFTNFTIGMGYLSGDISAYDNGQLLVNVSVLAQLSPRMYFVTENYLGDAGAGSDLGMFHTGYHGFRFVSKSNDVLCASIGLADFIAPETWFAFPAMSFTYKWGKLL